MLSNQFKIAVRNLKRYPVFTSINLFGLSVGMAACLLIFLFVRDELSYDRHHVRGDRIARVLNERTSESTSRNRASTPPGLAAALKEDYPEVEETARFYEMGRELVRRDDRQFYESGVMLADSTVFDVFTLPLVSGDPATALSAPFSLVISERLAKKYFDDEDPIGQSLELSGTAFSVTGIVQNPPKRSHLPMEMIGSFSTIYSFESEERLSNWIWQQFYTYVLLNDASERDRLDAKLPGFVERRATPETKSWGFTYAFSLQPLADIYLNSSHLEFDTGPRGNSVYVRIFSAIAAFILLIACFNFMNLSTARALQRAREVGLRKAVGAGRSQLVRQFLGESLLTAVAAFVVAVLLVWAGLPALNGLTGKVLRFDTELLGALALPVLVVIFVVGIVAGAYPAFYLARFRPVSVLKSGPAGPAGGGRLRKALVVVQFSIGVALLAGTGIVLKQLDFMRTTDVGFNREGIVKLPVRSGIRSNMDAVRDELLGESSIVNLTASWGTPGTFAAGDDIRFPGVEERWTTNMYLVDFDFIPTYDMQVVSGRAFDREFPSDAERAYVLNESAVDALGWTAEEAIGKPIMWDRWDADAVKEGEVIGVVRDFNYKSLHTEVEPLVMHVSTASIGQVSVRIAPGRIGEALAFLEQTWKRYAPGWPFEYEFLDQELAESYAAERSLARTTSVFAGLAILIACLGLFGLASFVVERRTREIGVRKVLGASTAHVVSLVSGRFLLLILLSIVVALPVVHFAMQSWMRNFAFQTAIGADVYVVAAISVLLLAFLTIGWQAARAARTDPALTLRHE